ncbi:MAG TPA: gliding motility-associated C-terminal domain-containing protein [Mucilaginibacter sp.]|jgi:gliding motility-associated-like protein/uncharacterized repeat protein (TIGR01451 family)|nr:gliding motility-associated C-terminal domain-containing protein [Mucilaginibacter sp.]
MKLLYKIIVICLLLTGIGATTLKAMAGEVTYTINQGQTITLHGSTANASAYQWFKDGISISGAVLKDYKASEAGEYTVVAFNSEGCPSVQSDPIRIIINPVIPVKPDTVVDLQVTIQSTNIHAAPGDNFTYILTANNNSVINGTHVQIKYTVPPNLVYVPQPADKGTVVYDSNTHTITWSIDRLKENDPIQLVVGVKVLAPGVIQSVVDIKGKEIDPILANNIDQTVQQVYPLVVPNVFTPNGDGKNDTFTIPGLDTYSDNEIVIINRWGNTVYQKTNYKNDWDGSGLVEGTYFYLLRAKNKAGVWDVYKGYLTLLRTKV